MGYRYKVTYNVRTTSVANGEFSRVQVAEERSLWSVTNELGEIFTDLFYLHREDSVIGLEVLSVEVWEETKIDELELVLV